MYIFDLVCMFSRRSQHSSASQAVESDTDDEDVLAVSRPSSKPAASVRTVPVKMAASRPQAIPSKVRDCNGSMY